MACAYREGGDVVSERTLLFGKHKGKAISECPVDYLDWLIGEDWLDADLKEDIEKYLMACPEWRRM